MAEQTRQPKLLCQFQYQYDRHASEKMAQAYRWLAPEESKPSTTSEQPEILSTDEKDRRHLRPSLF